MIRIKDNKNISLQNKDKEYIYLLWLSGQFYLESWHEELHLSEHGHTNLGPTVLVEWS